MKRIISFIIIAGLFLTGCSDSDTQHYYYEAFSITKSNYNSISYPNFQNISFETMKDYRDKLRNKMSEFLGSGTDATEDEIFELLTSRGCSAHDANIILDFLNSNGNFVIDFNHAYDSNLYIILYLEKL